MLSARNQLKGTISNVAEGVVNGVVTIDLGHGDRIESDITMDSISELGLAEGQTAYAVVKATDVMFATQRIDGISARNQLAGEVIAVKEGAVNGQVTIKITNGEKVSGSITVDAIEDLGLKEGDEAVAIFKATSVMVSRD